jgi:hypothetical protein
MRFPPRLVLLAAVTAMAATTAVAAAHPHAAVAAHHAFGAATTEPGHGTDPTHPGACDALDRAQCLLPYPSDWWTRPDPTTVTGRRVDFTELAMPRNVAGVPIDPTEYNRMDGFSPGSTLITHIPGMTTPAAFARNHIVPVTRIGAYRWKHQAVVVIDAATGQRWPVWAELDANAGSPAKTNLLIHPAKNFTEDTRYIVAIRHLVTTYGHQVQPSPAFGAYRDGTAPATDPRRAHMDELFTELHKAGIWRHNLDIAWDFTVASARSLAGRELSMRDRAFAELGDTDLSDLAVQGSSPKFEVASVTNYTKAQDPRIGRQVVVDVTVPCFIFPSCSVPTKTSDVTAPPPVGDQLPIDSVPPGAGTGHFVLDGDGPYAVPRENPVPFQARVV